MSIFDLLADTITGQQDTAFQATMSDGTPINLVEAVIDPVTKDEPAPGDPYKGEGFFFAALNKRLPAPDDTTPINKTDVQKEFQSTKARLGEEEKAKKKRRVGKRNFITELGAKVADGDVGVSVKPADNITAPVKTGAQL